MSKAQIDLPRQPRGAGGSQDTTQLVQILGGLIVAVLGMGPRIINTA
jgi:hypothetical protein